MGRNGVSTMVTAAPVSAALRPLRVARCGATIATNTTGNAASRPNVSGSMDDPASAPTNVPRFQHANSITAHDQKAQSFERWSGAAEVMAVVSSMTNCAASIRLASDPLIDGDRASP